VPACVSGWCQGFMRWVQAPARSMS
jgi:hypothetical protein